MGDFTTIFLFTNNAIKVFGLILGTSILVIVGFFQTIKYRAQPKVPSIFFTLLRAIALGLIGLGMAFGLLYSCQQYLNFSTIYNNKQYNLAEGTVSVLHTQPATGHDAGDIVRIDGVEFEINYFHLTLGYNKTIAHGGLLQEGVYARVYYHNGAILRVDLRNPETRSNILAYITDPVFLLDISMWVPFLSILAAIWWICKRMSTSRPERQP